MSSKNERILPGKRSQGTTHTGQGVRLLLIQQAPGEPEFCQQSFLEVSFEYHAGRIRI